MIRRLGPLALLALQGWGCGEPRLLNGFAEGLTRIRLVPSEFIGSVPCQKGTPGALQAYVVRLQLVQGSVEVDAGLSTAFTTGAVPCDQAVIFPSLAGRFYTADIRGLDSVPATEAEAALATGRWRATCGRGGTDLSAGDAGLDPYRSTLSLRGVTVPMRGCTSFGDTPAASQIVVDWAGALGNLECGSGAGQVAAFEATLNGVTRSAPCGERLAFDVPGPERYYTVQLTGLELGLDGGAASDASPPILPPDPPPTPPDAGADAGETPDASLPAPSPDALDAGSGAPSAPIGGVARWATQCVGRSLPGLPATAYCDPLRPLP